MLARNSMLCLVKFPEEEFLFFRQVWIFLGVLTVRCDCCSLALSPIKDGLQPKGDQRCMKPCSCFSLCFEQCVVATVRVCAWQSSCWVAGTKLRLVCLVVFSQKLLFRHSRGRVSRERRSGTGSWLPAGRSTSPSSSIPPKTGLLRSSFNS